MIENDRISVYDVYEVYMAEESVELTSNILGISEEGVTKAVEYYEENRKKVEAAEKEKNDLMNEVKEAEREVIQDVDGKMQQQ